MGLHENIILKDISNTIAFLNVKFYGVLRVYIEGD